MARNDGVDRTSVRNLAVSDKAVGNTQQHNEREKDSYRNPDIIPQRTAWNVHFKKPTASYTDLFAQLEAAGTISTRGLKPDAIHYCELVFDVNSAYFDNHGGYEFAKQFYEDAYKAAVQIVGGEQYILSAVMHADEINRAMTEALGREVYHYHLHVVYVPVVEKQILWSKRCKDKALVGKVKETVMQVSRSKKWASKPLLDDAGKPVLQKNGKPVLKKSYSVLQDDFFHYMRNAGYTDVERGERGLFLHSGKFIFGLGEGFVGLGEVLLFLVNLGGQSVQSLTLPLDFELGDGQVFFGAATFAALYIGVPGSAHKIEEVVLQDAVRLLQDRLAVLLQNRLSRFVQQRFGCPLLAPADLHDSLLYGTDQCLVLAAFRPQDLLFHHRRIDHMEVVVVDLPA